MVGDPEGDAELDAQRDAEGEWLALVVGGAERVETGVSLGGAEGVAAAEPVPVPRGEEDTEALGCEEADTEEEGVARAEAVPLRLFDGDEVPLAVAEAQPEALGGALPVGAPLAVATPVRDAEGLADALLGGVLEAEEEGDLHAEAEAVLEVQGVDVRDIEGLPEGVGHALAVLHVEALARRLPDAEGEPDAEAAAVALTVAFGERVCVPLTEGEGVP
jgi:hypothetical protein